MALPSSSTGANVPVLLLKTKSTPGDSYEDIFSSPQNGHAFEPTFVPVLHHNFHEPGMTTLRELLHRRAIHVGSDASYGGLIFTSQRAVEAFTKLIDDRPG